MITRTLEIFGAQVTLRATPSGIEAHLKTGFFAISRVFSIEQAALISEEIGAVLKAAQIAQRAGA